MRTPEPVMCICLLHGPVEASQPATQEDLFCDHCRHGVECLAYRRIFGTRLEPLKHWNQEGAG